MGLELQSARFCGAASVQRSPSLCAYVCFCVRVSRWPSRVNCLSSRPVVPVPRRSLFVAFCVHFQRLPLVSEGVLGSIEQREAVSTVVRRILTL